MLTPQDLQNVTFEKAKFGGYQMQSVDELLEPLMNDYVTLYKENAVLKSKMRLLVERLEDYRDSEARMKAEADETRGKCDAMLAEAKARCEEMIRKAQAEAQTQNQDLTSAVSAEQERLQRAKTATAEFVVAVQSQLARQKQSLEILMSMDLPKADAPKAPRRAYDYEAEKDPPRAETPREDAGQIAAQIEENVGRITDSYPNPDLTAATRVMPPIDLNKRATEKFADLQFGKNYHN